jgi:hypothetical protein
MATAAAPRMATAIRPMARSMVAAGKAGTAVGIMATLMATASLVTRGMRALRATKAMVALATASQDVPVLAGTAAGLDMAAEAGMVAGATTDDQDQEVRQQQPVFTRAAAKYPNPSRQSAWSTFKAGINRSPEPSTENNNPSRRASSCSLAA